MHFPAGYQDARSRFRQAAAQRDAHLHCLVQPDIRGPDGEELAIDVAVFGPPDAERAAMVITGVHGAEALCGSAVLNAWLTGGTAPPPSDLKLVLVHAANPWGYSHGLRTTENSVDLNRNFRRNWSSVENASYDLLRPFYHARIGDAADSFRLYAAYRSLLAAEGWHHEAEMTRGQTDHPDGLYYAGHRPEWANLAMRQLIRDHLGQARQIGVLDVHTGIGDFGEVTFLTFAARNSAAQRRVLTWWQADGPGRTVRPLPDYEGLLCRAIQEEVPDADVAGAVMEFGVADAFAMFRSDRLDRWLRIEGQNDPDHAALSKDYRESCSPSDTFWQRLVEREGPVAIDRMVQGVAWTGHAK